MHEQFRIPVREGAGVPIIAASAALISITLALISCAPWETDEDDLGKEASALVTKPSSCWSAHQARSGQELNPDYGGSAVHWRRLARINLGWDTSTHRCRSTGGAAA